MQDKTLNYFPTGTRVDSLLTQQTKWWQKHGYDYDKVN